MTALQKKYLVGLRKMISRAQKDLERDSALFNSLPKKVRKLLVQRHKSIIELCEKELAKLER